MKLRVLVAHNRYRETGGEDAAFEAEAALLREQGHAVQTLEEDSRSIREVLGVPITGTSVTSARSRLRVLQAIEAGHPDLAHFHNIHPLFTPSVFDACRERGVPVVQTLHNYRLICPAATLYRSGRVCELCVGRRIPWPSIVFACYRGSRLQSAAVTGMLGHHNALGTWRTKVGGYIALTQFMRSKLIEGGLPARKIFVKPNFVPSDPGARQGQGDFALFAGRLAPEKGLQTIIDAWTELGGRIPLRIVGAGPLAERVADAAAHVPGIEVLGKQPRGTVLELMKQARFLVFASGCYEGFPMVLAEAFACALPVVAARIGSAAEIVSDSRTGSLFTSGDPADLAAKAAWAWDHPQACAAMGREARLEYETRYTPEANYARLMEIYQSVIAGEAGGR